MITMLLSFIVPALRTTAQQHITVNVPQDNQYVDFTSDPNRAFGVVIDCPTHDCGGGGRYSTMPSPGSDQERTIRNLQASNSRMKRKLEAQGARLDSYYVWMQHVNVRMDDLDTSIHVVARASQAGYNQLKQAMIGMYDTLDLVKNLARNTETRVTALETIVGYTVDYIYFIDQYGNFKRKARGVEYTLPPKTFSTTVPGYCPPAIVNLNIPKPQKKKVKALGWKIGCIAFGVPVVADGLYMIFHHTNNTLQMFGGPGGNNGHN